MSARRSVARSLVVAGLLAASVLPGALPGLAQSTSSSGAFSKTTVLTRTNLVAGKDVVVDTRTFSVAVDRTKGLRGRDGLAVSWSGAHPTSGLISDINSGAAVQEEYPVVLLQCRGIDVASAPIGKRLRPETCFTQSPDERYTEDRNNVFPPWRLDRYAPLPERRIKVNVPEPPPSGCPRAYADVAQRYVPFVAASGKTFPIGSNGCASIPPEMSSLSTLGLPSNSTYGITALDGKGAARFDVRTAEDNASLGCSASVPCSLVVVPIMGISCDVGATQLPVADRPADQSEADYANRKCQATGHFRPGDFNTSPLNEDLSVAGALWWSASNWRQRIAIPLGFAPAADVCDVTSSKAPVYLYGSELLTQATAQWAPTFCLDKAATPFRHVQTGEPQARNLLRAGSIDAALSSRLPDEPPSVPTVNAPVAVTGFAIGFTVDDSSQNPLSRLALTPRLLAKLLSQSYPMLPVIKRDYTALSGNPLDVAEDPEFRALNPTVPRNLRASISASTLLALSTDSDVIHALTAYLQADPDARAFLDGAPDPWGMVVNPSYKGISLPADNWPLLDPYVVKQSLNTCLDRNPVPFFGLAAAPTQRLATVALDLQYALAPSQVICQQSPLGDIGDKLVAIGRQQGGYHFLLGVMSLADAKRYGVATASLLSAKAPSAADKFDSELGRTFVAPSDASMRAAVALMTADATAKSWRFDATVLRAKGPSAYPGTMAVFASVPTKGLPARTATGYQRFLEFAAGSGQTRGVALGQLPEGYLPLTSANGLGALAGYTLRAAAAVGAQSGVVPALIAPATAPTATKSVVAQQTAGPVAVPSSGVVAPVLPRVIATPPAQRPATNLPQLAPTPQPQAFPSGVTAGPVIGFPASIAPLVLVLGLVSGGLALFATGRPLPLPRLRLRRRLAA